MIALTTQQLLRIAVTLFVAIVTPIGKTVSANTAGEPIPLSKFLFTSFHNIFPQFVHLRVKNDKSSNHKAKDEGSADLAIPT